MRILFFGTDFYSTIALNNLIAHNTEVVGVVTGYNKTSMPFNYDTVEETAHRYGIPIIKVKNKKELLEKKAAMAALQPEVGLVASFGMIIPREIFELPQYNTVNIHPSLLPKYRGPAPIETAIKNGNTVTGVTLMQINEKMDEGDIIAQIEAPIQDAINSLDLALQLFDLGTSLFISLVKQNELPFPTEKQKHDAATYTKRYNKEDACINWENSEDEIFRTIRAYYPKPVAWTTLAELVQHYKDGEKEIPEKWNQTLVKIYKAHMYQGKVTPTRVQLEGKKPISWDEFCKGYLN